MREITHRVSHPPELIIDDADLSSMEHIANADSLDELGREVRKVSIQMGFEHYLYGARVPLSSGECLQYIFSGYPEA
jgi:hypothetical protein